MAHRKNSNYQTRYNGRVVTLMESSVEESVRLPVFDQIWKDLSLRIFF